MHLIAQLEREVGHTLLHEVCRITIPNGNRVFIKMESENLSGSHYDRVYLRLFSELERAGKIQRGKTRLIETTSGSAGRSVAAFGQALGYDVTVVVPSRLPPARTDAIKLRGAKVIEADGPTVKDAVAKLHEVLLEDKKSHRNAADRFFCMNHSRDSRSLEAMEPLADEVRDAINGLQIDSFVGACGNGTSLIGVGRRLRQIYPNAEIVGVEPEEACPISRAHGVFTSTTSKPATDRAHNVFGTGVVGVHFPFFEDPSAVTSLDRVMVISKEQREAALSALKDIESLDAGRSTALCFAAIQALCEATENKNYLTILYDCLSKYY